MKTSIAPCVPDQNLATLKLKPGKNRLLIKICQGGGEWAFYFKAGQPKVGVTPWFVDVSKKVGLGPEGLFGRLKGRSLAVADVNGDGRLDFLLDAGAGCLALNTERGFVESKDCGIAYKSGRSTPIFVNLRRGGPPDLFVPQNGACKLFQNDGRGHFRDTTASAGDLAKPVGDAVCAAVGDFDKDGLPDLFIGCLRGPNRFLRNRGDGSFADLSDAIGLTQKRFNTKAIALVDMNRDGRLDAVFVNEGQDSCLLLGSSGFSIIRTNDNTNRGN